MGPSLATPPDAALDAVTTGTTSGHACCPNGAQRMTSITLEKVAQRRHCLAWMPAPAQLKGTGLGHLAAKPSPLRLIGRIGLHNNEPPQRLCSGQRLQKLPTLRARRGQEDDGGKLHRSGCQTITSLAQVHFELPDPAASADDGRAADRDSITFV